MTNKLNNLRDQSLLSYIADLELEVDRLRSQFEFLRQSSFELIRGVLASCENISPAEESDKIKSASKEFAAILNDLRTSKGYHPAHDYVVAIAVRPIVEQVVRWQQRVHNAMDCEVNLKLECEHIEWFPGRFRHIVDNLVSNSLAAQEAIDGSAAIHIRLGSVDNNYELTVSDNGRVMLNCGRSVTNEMFYRSSPMRSELAHVNLAVVEALVDNCGGKCSLESKDGFTNVVVVSLPRFDINDYVD
jgi:signal transduction histidine kinase